MRKSPGYSLIELLVVLAILGLLASMAAPLAQVSAERARERELKRALWEIRDALDAYSAARKSGAIRPVEGVDPVVPYPPDLNTLTRVFPDQREGHHGEFLRFLRSVPQDPFASPSIPPEQGWATSSYFDNVDDVHAQTMARDAIPDVYDVHSRAAGQALDGTLLAQW